MSRNDDRIRCSFCGKTQNQVRKLIAGPNGAFIHNPELQPDDGYGS